MNSLAAESQNHPDYSAGKPCEDHHVMNLECDEDQL